MKELYHLAIQVCSYDWDGYSVYILFRFRSAGRQSSPSLYITIDNLPARLGNVHTTLLLL